MFGISFKRKPEGLHSQPDSALPGSGPARAPPPAPTRWPPRPLQLEPGSGEGAAAEPQPTGKNTSAQSAMCSKEMEGGASANRKVVSSQRGGVAGGPCEITHFTNPKIPGKTNTRVGEELPKLWPVIALNRDITIERSRCICRTCVLILATAR